MAIRGVNFKWFDGFFLSVLATNIAIVIINWNSYQSCTYPLHIWTAVDYTVVLTFRLLMFIDNGLASRLGLDFGWALRCANFYGRVVVLSILAFLLYPFLWAWTIIGTLWFSNTKICLSGGGQKWSFVIWLLFSYCGLLCIASVTAGKWLKRRQSHVLNSPEGMHISAFGILIEMIQVPDWAFEAARMAQNATFHPGLYLTEAQKEAMEASIQELPTFKLDAVPTTCNECLICLEEFCAGNQVRGLPCSHNFHVECIDEWLRLNVSCPRCRCSAFPNLNLNALFDLHYGPEDFSDTIITTIHDLNQTSR